MQCDLFSKSLLRYYKSNAQLYTHRVHHFRTPNCDHSISIVYPNGISEKSLEKYRTDIHQYLLLPSNRPVVRRSMRLIFPGEVSSSFYLRNPHEAILPQRGGEVALVDGIYHYRHYMQDNFDDNGWGCAYRSLQTLISWFVIQGYTDTSVANHEEIQQALIDVGDKPASFRGSRKWIGSTEVSYCLEKLIGVTSRIMFVATGADLGTKGPELLQHFNTHGTPVMIGGGVLAHTILGVQYTADTQDTRFLVLDPHYTGSEDLDVIIGQGWCGWKGVNFWDATSYYNLCLPQCPAGV